MSGVEEEQVETRTLARVLRAVHRRDGERVWFDVLVDVGGSPIELRLVVPAAKSGLRRMQYESCLGDVTKRELDALPDGYVCTHFLADRSLIVEHGPRGLKIVGAKRATEEGFGG